MQLFRQKVNNKGFSLVELMIVVAIIGIIAAIAVPQYKGYIESSKRQVAISTLEQFPVLLEAYRADHGIMCPDCDTAGTYTYNTKKIKENYPAFRASGKSTEASPYDYSLQITVKSDLTCSATYTATVNTEGGLQGYPNKMDDGTPLEGTYTE